MARCRSSAMPLTNGPGPSGETCHRLQIATRTEEPAGTGEHHDLGLGDVAAGGRVGEFGRHRVVHPVGGVGPVQGDAGDGSGLFEQQGLDKSRGDINRWLIEPISATPPEVGEVAVPAEGAQRPVGDHPSLIRLAGAVVGASIDDRLDQAERKINGIDVAVAFGDDLLRQRAVVRAQLRADQMELLEPRAPAVPAGGTARRGSSDLRTTGRRRWPPAGAGARRPDRCSASSSSAMRSGASTVPASRASRMSSLVGKW